LKLQQAKNKETKWERIPQEVVEFYSTLWWHNGHAAGGSPAVRARHVLQRRNTSNLGSPRTLARIVLRKSVPSS